MTTTVNQLKKDMHKQFELLTPEEKAQYTNMEYWRCVDESSNGNGGDARFADLIKTINNFKTPSWNNLDYFNYTNTLHDLQIREMHRRWTRERILGLAFRADYFKSKYQFAALQYHLNSERPVKQRDKNWKTNLKRCEDEMIECLEKMEEIQKAVNELLADYSVKDLGLELPVSEQKPA